MVYSKDGIKLFSLESEVLNEKFYLMEPKTLKILNMLPAGDLRDRDALGTGLCIHVALVIIGHAVGRTCEVGFSLTAVPALTNRLAIPDVTLGPLLRAHELVAGGALWHSNGAPVALDVYVACCHAALVTADVGTALLKGLAVLQLEKEQNFTGDQIV